MNQPPRSPRFPGLDELRFFAAFAIVILHIEEFKGLHGYQTLSPALTPLRMGVTFFFVLSGFLITYLLLAEDQASQTISLRRFYLRRCLRIWPLYFLVVLLGLLVVPRIPGLAVAGLTESVAIHWRTKLLLFLTFLPQVAFVAFPPVPYTAHSWSIGVEEHFYLIWPLLFKFTRRHLTGMFAVIIVMALGRILAEYVLKYQALAIFLTLSRIGCMAIGGVGAYVVFHRRQTVLAGIYHPLTQLLALGLVLGLVVSRLEIPYVAMEVHALLFGCIILNAACNPSALFKVRFTWLAHLGKWSYGIYLLHPLAAGACIWLLRSFGLDLGRTGPTLLLYSSTLAVTIGLSYLSYRYFEMPFLNLKNIWGAPPPAAASAASATPPLAGAA